MASSIVLRSGTPIFKSLGFGQRAHAVADAVELKHVLVIAGPSGSGKSTFMGEFVFDRLPKNISNHLPQGAKTWLRTSGNELGRKGLSRLVRGKGGSEGLVVHYDIMRAFSRGFEHYANDPAMQAVTEAKAALTVLTVLPPREVLFEQFLRRARNGEYEEWWDKRRLMRGMKRKLRGTLHKLTGRSPKLLKECHLGLLEVYGSDQALSHWTHRWETFLDGVRKRRESASSMWRLTPRETSTGASISCAACDRKAGYQHVFGANRELQSLSREIKAALHRAKDQGGVAAR